MQTVEEIVRDHLKASKALRKKLNTPAKSRKFLMEIGVLTKSGKLRRRR